MTGKPLSRRFSITTEAVLLLPEPDLPVIKERPVSTSTTGSSTGEPGSVVASPPIPSLTSATWIVSCSVMSLTETARPINPAGKHQPASISRQAPIDQHPPVRVHRQGFTDPHPPTEHQWTND